MKIATLCPRTPWREASSSRAASGGAAGAGRLPGGGQAGPADSHGCAGPSIGRAGRPHRPPCSPQWHLSREGAVSQDPPRSHRRPACSAATSPHPRAGSLLRAGHTGARLSPPPPAAHSGHISSFPLSFLPELLRQVSPRARTMGKGGDRERGEDGEGAGFLSEGPRPPGKAARASLSQAGQQSRPRLWTLRAEAGSAGTACDRLRPAFCGPVSLPAPKQPDGGGDDGDRKSNVRETLPGRVASPSPPPARGSPPLTPKFHSSVGHSAFLRVSRK